jgi:hypothetical protein
MKAVTPHRYTIHFAYLELKGIMKQGQINWLDWVHWLRENYTAKGATWCSTKLTDMVGFEVTSVAVYRAAGRYGIPCGVPVGRPAEGESAELIQAKLEDQKANSNRTEKGVKNRVLPLKEKLLYECTLNYLALLTLKAPLEVALLMVDVAQRSQREGKGG